jgi:type IV pilus assembly protein PilO
MALDLKDPRTQKSLLGGLVLAVILYCYFFTSLLPITYKANASQVGELEVRYRDLTKDLNKARQAAHRLPYLENEYQLLHRKWEQSQSLLPPEQDMAWLLRTVSLLGTQAGIEFTLFKPLPPKPAQYHTENPIQIKVVGGYHQIGAFLSEMANLDRIVNVTDLELTTNKDKENDAEQPASASFVAVTYTLGGTGVPPDQPPEEKAKGPGKGAKAPEKGTKAKPPAGAVPSGSATGGSRGGENE